MDINIRKAVLHNLNNATVDDVKSTIEDAMSRNEEVVLPGLGVLFEVLYRSSDDTEKQKLIDKLVQNLH